MKALTFIKKIVEKKATEIGLRQSCKKTIQHHGYFPKTYTNTFNNSMRFYQNCMFGMIVFQINKPTTIYLL